MNTWIATDIYKGVIRMHEVIFLVGVIVGLVINNIYWRRIKPDGTMLIREQDDKDIFKMLMNQDLSCLKTKKIVVFRVKKMNKGDM